MIKRMLTMYVTLNIHFLIQLILGHILNQTECINNNTFDILHQCYKSVVYFVGGLLSSLTSSTSVNG